MTTIELVGLEFYAYHGVPDAEQAVGHRYRMDLTLGLSDESYPIFRSDAIEGLVDYSEVASEALRAATDGKFRTLEFLVQRVGSHVMETFLAVQELEVRIAKIAPPMPFILDEVAVSRTFARPDK